MTRGRLRAAGTVLAVLLLALTAWLLAPGGPEGGRSPDEAPPAARPIVSGDETPVAPGAPPGPPPRPNPAEKGGASGAADPAAKAAATHALEGVCVLEGGMPLAGVVVSNLIEESPFPRGRSRSDVNGKFRIDAPAGKQFRASVVSSELVSVDGGSIAEREPLDIGTVFTAESGPVRLVFRDKPGTAHVRLRNADTDASVTSVDGLRVAYLFQAGSLSYRVSPDPGLGGWIPLPEGRLPEIGPDPEGRDRDLASVAIDLEKVEVEFAMPGFEKGTLPLRDIRGRMELRVRPVPADATGEIVHLGDFDVEVASEAFIADPFERVRATLRWTGPDPAPSVEAVQGLPTRGGRFALYDLPQGSWYLEFAATNEDNSVVRGGRAFEFRGAPVELGRIELRASGKVSICVLDAASKPIPQAWAVIVRPEENPDQGRRLDLDERGVVTLGDLEPGATHRVVVKGLPRELEQTAIATEKTKFLEFRWPERLVDCRIALIVDGRAVANADGRTTIPAVVQESPLPRDKGAWGADGTFEAKLVPGTYRFSALATPKDGGDLALFSGEVTVPAGDAFETRLELKR